MTSLFVSPLVDAMKDTVAPVVVAAESAAAAAAAATSRSLHSPGVSVTGDVMDSAKLSSAFRSWEWARCIFHDNRNGTVAPAAAAPAATALEDDIGCVVSLLW